MTFECVKIHLDDRSRSDDDSDDDDDDDNDDCVLSIKYFVFGICCA